MRQRRQRAQTQELDEATERTLVRTGDDPAETAELGRFLAARIAALPVEYRAPLVLRDLEGLSNAEVAETLGLSVAAAKSRIHRARMTIRVELEEWERGA
jgi:RNA polymerase sigma factor (sigma-70 family)